MSFISEEILQIELVLKEEDDLTIELTKRAKKLRATIEIYKEDEEDKNSYAFTSAKLKEVNKQKKEVKANKVGPTFVWFAWDLYEVILRRRVSVPYLQQPYLSVWSELFRFTWDLGAYLIMF